MNKESEAEEKMDPIDVLSYITEELQGKFNGAKDGAAQAKIFDDFLQRWEAEEGIKQMNIEFKNDLEWFNVSNALQMSDLRGKLVVLDFFTYCCINCMHVLPELRQLEELYPVSHGLVVVGVHSPKFENEKDAHNILSAAQRYGIQHPIVNDPQSSLWGALGIRCWPTLLVVSPSGTPLLMLMGEGHAHFLEVFVGQALQYFGSKNEIANFALPLRPSRNLLPPSRLCFPAKIARCEQQEMFALADAGNHRILVFERSGNVIHIIGGCTSGFVDGAFKQARFNSPQGVCFLDEHTLIVADTENHAIRKLTLATGQVETLAGIGEQGHDRAGGQLGTQQPISSPWDIALFRTRDMDMSFHLDEQNVPEKTIMLISMSGTHQIWGYFPDGIILWKFRRFEPCTCAALVGNGLEENRNNSYPQNAAFAQPSGIVMAKNCLFIADSESSSVRKVSMLDGKVTAVVGGDRNPLNLFAFGDIDGKQYNAKLQHPLGVTYNAHDDKVYVADTYNHKIKVIDYAANTIETLAIKDTAGSLYRFNEPAGLCFDASGDYLLIADTNNHLLQLLDVRSQITKPFTLHFPVQTATTVTADETDAALKDVNRLLKRLPLSTYKTLELRVKMELGTADLRYTAEAPQKWMLNASNSALQPSHKIAGALEHGLCAIQLQRGDDTPFSAAPESLTLNLALSLCNANSCLMKRFALVISDDGSSNETTTAQINAQELLKICITENRVELQE